MRFHYFIIIINKIVLIVLMKKKFFIKRLYFYINKKIKKKITLCDILEIFEREIKQRIYFSEAKIFINLRVKKENT